ncbi:hypothetical protein HPB50_029260 [Hyalomma asiaticum]|nr:hypothetical protein HPB50_029260 [Hyalomma asiaticum]
MQRLPSSSSSSSNEEFVTGDGGRWRRFKTGIFIAVAVVILSTFIAALAVPLKKAASSVEDGVEAPKSTPLPWRERQHESRVPRILLWTSPVAQPATKVHASHPVPHFAGSWMFRCPLPLKETVTCELTMEHDRTNESDALVFLGENITASLLPQFRTARQLWVFAAAADLPPPGVHKRLSQISGIFNWTMGRRVGADITVAYRTYECIGSDEDIRTHKDTELHKHKRHAAWIVGNCEHKSFTNARRHFMGNSVTGRQRRGAIHVHLLQACGINECGSRRNCVRRIAQKYHFIIVSRVPECFQSASEIVYEAFAYNVVPVLLETETSVDFPPKSVISFSTMPNPGELAAYLRLLILFPPLYRQYFEWKRECTVKPPMTGGLCSLCGALHEKPLRRSRVNSVLEWWEQPRHCMHNLSAILKNSSFMN